MSGWRSLSLVHYTRPAHGPPRGDSGAILSDDQGATLLPRDLVGKNTEMKQTHSAALLHVRKLKQVLVALFQLPLIKLRRGA